MRARRLLYTQAVSAPLATGDTPRAQPAWPALALGGVFALALTLAHARAGMEGLGVVSAWAFSLAASLPVSSARRHAALFAVAPLLGYAWLQRWLLEITVPGYIALVIVMGVLLGMTMWLAVRLAKRTPSRFLSAALAAVLLAAFEFARGRVIFSGYPWYLLGQPSIDIAGIPALASWIGMHGVNALVCLVGAALTFPILLFTSSEGRVSQTLGSIRLRVVLSFLLAWGLPSAASMLTRWIDPPPTDVSGGVPIAVVQTNVPQSNKQSSTPEERVEQFADAARLTTAADELSIDAFGEPPAFIAWPETMFPAPALNADAVDALREAPAEYFAIAAPMRDALLMLQTSMGTPMLVGAMALDNPRVVPAEEEGYVRLEHDASYNSVFHLAYGNVRETRYDKTHLTPFGEVMPLISRWDWLERQLLSFGAPGMSFDLTPGDAPVRFDVRGLRVATPICFEATMPHVCRRLVFENGERRADILLNVTNDGWFGSSEAGRRNHLLLARWRAAELATPMVRAANTGLSCFIDASGRVYTQRVRDGVWAPGRLGEPYRGPLQEEAALVARVVPGTGATLYARTGDVVGWAVFLVGCVLAVFAAWPAKNRANPAPSPNAVEPSTA